MDIIKAYFSKNQATFFYFQIGQGRHFPLPIFAPMSVVEYASISLKMYKLTVLSVPGL